MGGWPGFDSCAALGDHGRRVAAGKPWRNTLMRMHGERCVVSAAINIRLSGRPTAAMRRPRLRDEPVPGAPGRPPPCRLHRRPPSANVILNKKNVNVKKKQLRILKQMRARGPSRPGQGAALRVGGLAAGRLTPQRR